MYYTPYQDGIISTPNNRCWNDTILKVTIVSRSLFPGPGRWPPTAIEVVCNLVVPLRCCCKCKWQETHKQAFSSASFLCFRTLFPQNPSTDHRTIANAGRPHCLLGASVHKGQFERWRLLEESLKESLHLAWVNFSSCPQAAGRSGSTWRVLLRVKSSPPWLCPTPKKGRKHPKMKVRRSKSPGGSEFTCRTALHFLQPNLRCALSAGVFNEITAPVPVPVHNLHNSFLTNVSQCSLTFPISRSASVPEGDSKRKRENTFRKWCI